MGVFEGPACKGVSWEKDGKVGEGLVFAAHWGRSEAFRNKQSVYNTYLW